MSTSQDSTIESATNRSTEIFEPESEERKKVKEICQVLSPSNEKMRYLEQRIEKCIREGLEAPAGSGNSVKCLPTYVRHLPTGQEHGQFLALELAGSKVEVSLVNISESKQVSIESLSYDLSTEIKRGPVEGLFDHLAQCLEEFLKAKKIMDVRISLGFAFSFACQHKGLQAGKLINWSKGFECTGVEGKDVVLLLKEALGRRNLTKIEVEKCNLETELKKSDNYKVRALVNDATCCLTSCSWVDRKCKVGVILNFGTNACYLEVSHIRQNIPFTF